jgi:hypothetical protein
MNLSYGLKILGVISVLLFVIGGVVFISQRPSQPSTPSTPKEVKETPFVILSVNGERSASLVLGEEVNVTGQISEYRSNLTQKINVYADYEKECMLIAVIEPRETFSFKWKPQNVGLYKIYAVIPGIEYQGWFTTNSGIKVNYECIARVKVYNERAVITLEVEPSSIKVGEVVTIQGKVSNSAVKSVYNPEVYFDYVSVTIYYRIETEKEEILGNAKPISDGSFSLTWIPSLPGKYLLRAEVSSWEGTLTTTSTFFGIPQSSETRPYSILGASSAPLMLEVNP